MKRRWIWFTALLLVLLSLSLTACDESEVPPCDEHTFGEWVTTAEPTCMQGGERQRVCSVCQTAETEPLAAVPTAHTLGFEWVTDGEKHFIQCQNEGCVFVTNEAEHTHGQWEADASMMYRCCGVCGTRYESAPHYLYFGVKDGVCYVTGFNKSSDLTQVTIPEMYNGNRVTHIAANAFKGSKKITRVTLPNTLIYIGESAFADCTKLVALYYNGRTSDWYSVRVGANWIYNTKVYQVFCKQ